MKTTDLHTWLEELQHPLKQEMLELRHIILEANKNLREHIKWNAPSYYINEEDRITFNLRAKDQIRLVFHCGVKIKARKLKGRISADTQQWLQWPADDRALLSFSDMIEIMQKKKTTQQIINEWIKITS